LDTPDDGKSGSLFTPVNEDLKEHSTSSLNEDMANLSKQQEGMPAVADAAAAEPAKAKAAMEALEKAVKPSMEHMDPSGDKAVGEPDTFGKDGEALPGADSEMEDLQRGKQIAKEAADATKEGLQEVRAELDKLPPSKNMTRDERAEQLQLLKQEAALTAQHREALEEQLKFTRAVKQRTAALKAKPESPAGQGQGMPGGEKPA
jgi:hypothetical protein